APRLALPSRARDGDNMTKSIRALLSSAAHSVVRGFAVVALVVVWSVGHIGTYALSVVGVSSAVLTTTATPADAWWRRWGWRGRRWRRWRRWRWGVRPRSSGGAPPRVLRLALLSFFFRPSHPPGRFPPGLPRPT